jgi:hypothetical protein
VCSFISVGAISDCAGAIRIAQLLRLHAVFHARAHVFCICSYEFILFDGDVVQCASLVSLSFDIKKRIFIAVKKVY